MGTKSFLTINGDLTINRDPKKNDPMGFCRIDVCIQNIAGCRTKKLVAGSLPCYTGLRWVRIAAGAGMAA